MPRSPHKLLRRLRHAEDGAVVVEFAIVLPVLLTLLLGLAEVGRALWYHQLVTKSVRDATRYLARVPAPFSGADLAAARNLALRGSTDGGAPLLIAQWSDPGTVGVSGPALWGDPAAFRRPVQKIGVTADVPFTFPLLGFLGIDTAITVQVADEQRWIGE